MTVRQTKNTMVPSLKKLVQRIGQLPEEAHEFWVSITPIRSGRARRSTRLRDDTISAEYPYARELDGGSSRQAPQGMSVPTEKFIRREMKKKLRK
jgi:hypothetical protein